ncbi:unnamed protein product [Closterium sp. Yama58-4]|nr:unnamed protein product [Closterium sp. Yama58-4]
MGHGWVMSWAIWCHAWSRSVLPSSIARIFLVHLALLETGAVFYSKNLSSTYLHFNLSSGIYTAFSHHQHALGHPHLHSLRSTTPFLDPIGRRCLRVAVDVGSSRPTGDRPVSPRQHGSESKSDASARSDEPGGNRTAEEGSGSTGSESEATRAEGVHAAGTNGSRRSVAASNGSSKHVASEGPMESWIATNEDTQRVAGSSDWVSPAKLKEKNRSNGLGTGVTDLAAGFIVCVGVAAMAFMGFKRQAARLAPSVQHQPPATTVVVSTAVTAAVATPVATPAANLATASDAKPAEAAKISQAPANVAQSSSTELTGDVDSGVATGATTLAAPAPASHLPSAHSVSPEAVSDSASKPSDKPALGPEAETFGVTDASAAAVNSVPAALKPAETAAPEAAPAEATAALAPASAPGSSEAASVEAAKEEVAAVAPALGDAVRASAPVASIADASASVAPALSPATDTTPANAAKEPLVPLPLPVPVPVPVHVTESAVQMVEAAEQGGSGSNSGSVSSSKEVQKESASETKGKSVDVRETALEEPAAASAVSAADDNSFAASTGASASAAADGGAAAADASTHTPVLAPHSARESPANVDSPSLEEQVESIAFDVASAVAAAPADVAAAAVDAVAAIAKASAAAATGPTLPRLTKHDDSQVFNTKDVLPSHAFQMASEFAPDSAHASAMHVAAADMPSMAAESAEAEAAKPGESAPLLLASTAAPAATVAPAAAGEAAAVEAAVEGATSGEAAAATGALAEVQAATPAAVAAAPAEAPAAVPASAVPAVVAEMEEAEAVEKLSPFVDAVEQFEAAEEEGGLEAPVVAGAVAPDTSVAGAAAPAAAAADGGIETVPGASLVRAASAEGKGEEREKEVSSRQEGGGSGGGAVSAVMGGVKEWWERVAASAFVPAPVSAVSSKLAGVAKSVGGTGAAQNNQQWKQHEEEVQVQQQGRAAGQRVVVRAAADAGQQQAVQDLQLLGVIEGHVDASSICSRREFARWLVHASNALASDPAHRVQPAMYIDSLSTPAFDDVGPQDPDYSAIQGLAEAGLISSKLSFTDLGCPRAATTATTTTTSASAPSSAAQSSDSSQSAGAAGSAAFRARPGCNSGSGALFHPDSPLTRQDLVSWKAALDSVVQPHDVTMLAQLSSQPPPFIDMDRIDPDALPSVLLDAAKRDTSIKSNTSSNSTTSSSSSGGGGIVTTAFGFTRRFDPQKPVTRGQAAIALAAAGEGRELVREAVGRARAERAAAAALEAAQAEAERRLREAVREMVERDEVVGEDRRVRKAMEEAGEVLRATAERVEGELEQEKASIRQLKTSLKEQQQQAERERQEQQQAAASVQERVQNEMQAVRQQWEEVQRMLGQAEEAAERAREREREVQGEKEALQKARVEAEAELQVVRAASERVQQAWRELAEREREVQRREEQEREKQQLLQMEMRDEQQQQEEGKEGRKVTPEGAGAAGFANTADDADANSSSADSPSGLSSFINRLISLSPFSRAHPQLDPTPASVAAPVAVDPSEWGVKVAAEAAHGTTAPAAAAAASSATGDATTAAKGTRERAADGDGSAFENSDEGETAGMAAWGGLGEKGLDPQVWKARASELVQPVGKRVREAVRAAEKGWEAMGERVEGIKREVGVAGMQLEVGRAVGEAAARGRGGVEEGRRAVEQGAKAVGVAGVVVRERVGEMVEKGGKRLSEVVQSGGKKVDEVVEVGGKTMGEIKGKVGNAVMEMKGVMEEAWSKIADGGGEGDARGKSGSAS